MVQGLGVRAYLGIQQGPSLALNSACRKLPLVRLLFGIPYTLYVLYGMRAYTKGLDNISGCMVRILAKS